MKLILKRSRFSTMALTWLIVLSLSWGALAHGAASPPVTQAPWFTEEAAVPLSDDELAQVSGELSHIVSGAIAGAIYSAFEYATSPGEKSLGGLVKQAAVGAAIGAVTGAAATVAAVATATKAVTSAASTAWAAWGSANAGAISGAVKHLTGQ